MSLLTIFATAILPVVTVAAAGFALGRVNGTDPDALNTITVYVLAPALVVHSLTTSTLAGNTILSVVLAVALFTAASLSRKASAASRGTRNRCSVRSSSSLSSRTPGTTAFRWRISPSGRPGGARPSS
ncbi:hypothetical protein SAMN05443574_106158 [Haloarcula vallismortis]|uniref:Uncharacterized protein n=1 Tax=Haloarcula vallismortis TaxID=28442 RepID=A0A1H2W3F4_HALVA|nr:hypothetical protein SAMN05443574_106158 [Haloarcula vallismortis]